MDSNGNSITGDDFINQILEEYSALYEEIEEGERRELDLRPRLIRRLFCNVLGWEHSEYAQEDEWNDVRFYDEDRTPVIIIEGKRRDVDIDEGVPQVFRYASETPYADLLISTNIDWFQLYRRCDSSHPDAITHHGVSARPITKIDFKSHSEANSRVASHEDLSQGQRQSLQKLAALRSEEVLNADRYEDFSFENPADISEDEGFRELIRVLGISLNEYFVPHSSETFDQYLNRYEEYESQRDELEQQIARLEESGHDEAEVAELRTQLSKLSDEYEEYAQFHNDFETWVRLSGRQDEDFEDNKLVFCRESVYVQLNKLLLIRIAEDKGLTNRMISNGGVEDYFAFWDDYTKYVERNYVELFELASEELSEIYEHLFARRIFDWEIRDDAGLDEVIQRTLWHLNHFDFSEVNRDILGHLYEEHLSPEERKKLGEFYTPTAIIDQILESVDYTPDKPLEREDYDLLDPACGSGGFLVRAARRLLERLDRKDVPAGETIEIVRKRLHGFDINPFACHIAEINLLFQVIDKYQTAKEENPDFTLDGFNIYQTDSLRSDNQVSLTALHSSEVQRRYREERREANRLKTRNDYRFVIGNPPYVRKQNVPIGPARVEYDDYDVAKWNYDLSILFFRKAGDWLQEGGHVGFITSNKFIPNRYGTEIRSYLAQHFRFRYLIDFGDYDVFETPQAYPIIIAGERINKNERARSTEEFQPEDYVFTFAEATDTLPSISQTAIRADIGEKSESENGGEGSTLTDPEREIGEDPPEGRIADIIGACLPESPDEEPPNWNTVEARLREMISDNDFESSPIRAFPVPSSMIADEDWRFVPADEEEALGEIEAGGTQFREYANGEELSKNGVQTGANPVFKLTVDTLREYDFEDELVEELVSGEDVHRWHTDVSDFPKLLYIANDDEIDEYPGAKEYLLDHKDDLEDRYCVTDEHRRWFDLARNRPHTFGKELIFTPDVSYYSNFWYEPTGEVYGLNSIYVLYIIDRFDPYYQLGIFNSNVAQFFIRRIASSYGSDYLRYQWDYMKKVPLPDPSDAPSESVADVKDAAEELSDLREEYVEAKQLRENPAGLLDEFQTKSLSYAGYIDLLGYQHLEGELHPSLDETIIRFGVTGAGTEFNDERSAEIVYELLQALEITTADELRDLELPALKEDLVRLYERYEDARSTVEEAPEKAKELEREYNEVVYNLYDLDDETKSLIRDRVARPDNPLEPRDLD
jgi:type I restriction-modification system DNA methylase subunit